MALNEYGTQPYSNPALPNFEASLARITARMNATAPARAIDYQAIKAAAPGLRPQLIAEYDAKWTEAPFALAEAQEAWEEARATLVAEYQAEQELIAAYNAKIAELMAAEDNVVQLFPKKETDMR